MNNGAPLEVIQNLLGHEKSETTRIYAQLSGTMRREFYRKYFWKLDIFPFNYPVSWKNMLN